MREIPHIPASVTRWGLLLTTVALAIVLVGTGVAGYLGARETSRAVTRARGLDMVMSIRRAVVRSGGDPRAALDEALLDLEEQGLRYAAVIRRGGGVIAEAGEARGRVDETTLRGIRPRHGVQTAVVGDRVQVVAAFGPRRGRGLARGQKTSRWRDPPGRRLWKGAGFDGPSKGQAGVVPARPGPRGGVLVLEFEPLVARSVTRRATIMLLVSVISGTMLLVAALVFWRSSRRAEEMEAQLARDRQLKALGQMSAVLGHELRNPLASLKGHAQLLVERLEEGSRPRKGAERVVREALRMEKLTEQILDFARTGAVDPAPVDPREVVRAAVEQVEGPVEVHLADDLPETWPLDRIRVERVLINFLKNGLQASGAEGGDASVELDVHLDGEELHFSVRDHGPGIPAGEEDKIFEPFHTKRVQGTGLGLAVAKQIVEAHGGRISASNHPGGGALFEARLPRAPVAATAAGGSS